VVWNLRSADSVSFGDLRCSPFPSYNMVSVFERDNDGHTLIEIESDIGGDTLIEV
jgi:hypothetical protein